MDALTTAALIASASTLAGTLVGHLLQRGTSRQLKRMSDQLERAATREGEQHRFRHQMGEFAAKERLSAYVKLAELAMAAYRAKMGKDWNDAELMKLAERSRWELLNFYYDHRFFFTEGFDGIEGSVKSLSGSLREEFPNKAQVETHLQALSNTVRRDLLLDQLAASAVRAIGAATTATTTTITTP